MPTAVPVTMAEVRLNFEGSLKPLVLRHQPAADGCIENLGSTSLTKVLPSEIIQDGKASLLGETSLTFRPGQTTIFEFSTALREAGEGSAVSAIFIMNTDLFDLEYHHKFEPTTAPDVWWGADSVKKRIVRLNSAAITVLPKPPKLELRFLGLREEYYTNEEIILQLEVVNEEDADAIVHLDIRILGDGAPAVELKVPVSNDTGGESGSDLGISLGTIASAASTTIEVSIPSVGLPAVYDISMKATYSLVSDLETPIYRSMAMQLEVTSPFEANYDFSPRIHADLWPSLFTHIEGEDVGTEVQAHGLAHGLAQKWC